MAVHEDYFTELHEEFDREFGPLLCERCRDQRTADELFWQDGVCLVCGWPDEDIRQPPPQPAASEAELRFVLTWHWLAGMDCDETTHMDRPRCACSNVDLGWHENIGTARDVWVDHVLHELAARAAAGGGNG